MVVVADLELGEEHNLVMDKFFQYLRSLLISMLIKLAFHRIQINMKINVENLAIVGPRVG